MAGRGGSREDREVGLVQRTEKVSDSLKYSSTKRDKVYSINGNKNLLLMTSIWAEDDKVGTLEEIEKTAEFATDQIRKHRHCSDSRIMTGTCTP